MNNGVKITLQDLAEMVGAIYYSEDEIDLSSTESLIEYLEDHGENFLWINMNK